MNNPNFANRSEAKIPSWRDCQLSTNSCVSRLSFLVFLLTFYILNSTFCIAEVRYVSKTGSSTPPYTSWETAADSIQKAINICLPGDTVMVANGVYYENLVINTSISLIGSSMDSTVIDGRGMGDHTIIFNASGIIENFNIYGRGARLSGAAIRNLQSINFINVKNCKISETSMGIGLVNSSITAENIFMKDLIRGFSLFSSNIYTYNISGCTMILNTDDSYGIQIGFAENANAYISNNTILFIGTNDPFAGISVGVIKKIYVHNNFISGLGGIYFDTVIDTAFVKNNLFSYSGGIYSSYNRMYANNIIFSNNYIGIEEGESNFISNDYNIFWNNETDLIGLTYGDSDRVADPMFVNDTIPNSQFDFDYHLQAYSPGINKGDPDILDVDGSRSDIGLYGGPFGESYTYQDLAPRQPVNLSGIVDSNYILLNWNRNSEADTSHYNVYRDTIPDFTIDSTKLITSTADTFFVQYPLYENSQYVYKITCTDNQGNESLPSEEVVIKPVSVNEHPQIVNDYYLYQNYPNPFNPSTRIGYKIRERGYVKLMVYDIKGEIISVLVNKEQDAGYYEIEFNIGQDSSPAIASGIYLYRIEVIGKGNIPVYSEMKKMVLIK